MTIQCYCASGLPEPSAPTTASALADALRKLLLALGPAGGFPRDVAAAIANAEAVLVAYEAPPFDEPL